MTFVPESYTLPMTKHKPTVYVMHRRGETEVLRAFDWTVFGLNSRIYICAEGYRDTCFNGWDEAEWPHGIRLAREDFADNYGSVFVCYFESRIKISRTNAPVYPRLHERVLEEISSLDDYLLTYDNTTDEYNIRVREITPEIEHQWILAKIRRS